MAPAKTPGQFPTRASRESGLRFLGGESEQVSPLVSEPIPGLQAFDLFGDLVSGPVDRGQGVVYGGLGKLIGSHCYLPVR